mmetsp:Transcript_7417/g.17906  ORF Transcript_7417/g.17906 Transcript_7417/m.17906 type:complete len:337 (+) Transcript_7417:117-1127(+)|eukprot:CAMPEP_0178986284 /NCGR_PEP_ID=MMETSP0795-20121207/2623_1 /TAXON_ID=88552 /ORGANISM="Amoebophrya sp., Strain Ameob2" /LENGTH=336 /DNA_ID=CAMNT_0020677337 /DNA_START=62 /DNA_END=1072 /DNA_ORIENTATION=+
MSLGRATSSCPAVRPVLRGAAARGNGVRPTSAAAPSWARELLLKSVLRSGSSSRSSSSSSSSSGARREFFYLTTCQKRFLKTQNVAPGLASDMVTPKGHSHRENRQRLAGHAYFTYQGCAFTVFFGMGMFWFLDYLSKNMMKRQRAAIVEQESIGTPKLGGPWTLYDRTGKLVTSADFRGKYQLVYFGFSYCPDVCPEEMEKQRIVVEKLDKMFHEQLVEPIFISVDPGRDTVAQVDSYCSEFHPRLQGFTGTPEMIKKVTRSFRVYYNEGIRADGEDYLVDHSIIQYLMDRNGKFVDFFGKNMTSGEIVNKISAQILVDQGKFQKGKYDANSNVD